MKKNGYIDQAIFSFYVDLERDTSKLIFGIDSSMMAPGESVEYHPVQGNDKNKWSVSLQKVCFDETCFEYSEWSGDSDNGLAIVDSGSTWMVVPPPIFDKFSSLMKGQGLDCDTYN